MFPLSIDFHRNFPCIISLWHEVLLPGCKPCIACENGFTFQRNSPLCRLSSLSRNRGDNRRRFARGRVRAARRNSRIASDSEDNLEGRRLDRKENVVSSWIVVGGRIYRLLFGCSFPPLGHSWLAKSKKDCWRNARRPTEEREWERERERERERVRSGGSRR